MSVAFDTSGRSGRYIDTEEVRYSYATTTGGVLQVIEFTDSGYRVVAEVSPSYWHSVTGDRFTGDATKMPGVEPPAMSQGQAFLEHMKNVVDRREGGA